MRWEVRQTYHLLMSASRLENFVSLDGDGTL